MLIAIEDSFDNALLFASERMQDGVGLGQVKNISSAGHLIIMNRCQNDI